MGIHRGIVIQCNGLRPSSSDRCGVPIMIALDMGPSAFRCPVCDTIYIVDSLQSGSPITEENFVSVTMEMEGHRVEMYTGPQVHTIRHNAEKAKQFYMPKIGAIEKAYVAQAYLDPMDIVKIELDAAVRGVQSYRPNKPFIPLEQALGLTAFATWLEMRQQNDELYLMSPNESARLVAIQIVEEVLSKKATIELIRAEVPSFDPETEVIWAKQKVSHSQWQATLTRAIIMLCRELAYRYTGIVGEKSDLLDQLRPDELTRIAIGMYRQIMNRHYYAMEL
jgi:hypothetical protein